MVIPAFYVVDVGIQESPTLEKKEEEKQEKTEEEEN